jgi:hypothetical protein
MEVNGMKKNREMIEMKPEVEISLTILPFGTMSYETIGGEEVIKEVIKEDKKPIYVEPVTTHAEEIEIRYGEDGTYSVPKTTAIA